MAEESDSKDPSYQGLLNANKLRNMWGKLVPGWGNKSGPEPITIKQTGGTLTERLSRTPNSK